MNRVVNETDQLRQVIIGSAIEFPKDEASQAYDPRSLDSLKKGVYPSQESLIRELDGLVKALEHENVQVLRPQRVANCNQVFSRDLGFVIEDTFFFSSCIEGKLKEQEGISFIKDYFKPEKIVSIPAEIHIEGGDVILNDSCIFLGFSPSSYGKNYLSARTNQAALDFIRVQFPNKKVIGIELIKSDTDPKENALHLDCAMQPLGGGGLIISPEYFLRKKDADAVMAMFDKDKIISLPKGENPLLYTNVLSISPQKVVSDPRFSSSNAQLKTLGYQVIEVSYRNIGLLGGLFRCTSLPLSRGEK